jgi:hypothetical protein
VARARVAAWNEDGYRARVETREFIEFDDVHPTLARFTLRNERLGPIESACDIDLREPRTPTCSSQEVQEFSVARSVRGTDRASRRHIGRLPTNTRLR